MRTSIVIDEALMAGPYQTNEAAVPVVDPGVWIDHFRDAPRGRVDLQAHPPDPAEVRIVVPGLVLFEGLGTVSTGSPALARTAAQHCRGLRVWKH